MSGKAASPARLGVYSPCADFYGESSPKRSRLHESHKIHRPAFKSFKENLIKFDKKLSQPIKGSSVIKESEQPSDIAGSEETKNVTDRDSPLPLKNLGNTCYENSIIQCLFSLDMFMDNFKRSMEDMRRYVVKSAAAAAEYQQRTAAGSFTPTTETDRATPPLSDQMSTHNQSESTVGLNESGTKAGSTSDASVSTTTISDSDVRYRIADAFDELFKSYTKRRTQIESAKDSRAKRVYGPEPMSIGCKHLISKDYNNEDTIASNGELSDFAISQPNKAISLCKSDPESSIEQADRDQKNSEPVDSDEDLISIDMDSTTSQTLTATTTSTTNLTPIALVSSAAATSNEQSEIETRLEDLKTAVGERSSQFNSTHQQDASEFFYHVIDSIQEFYQSLDRKENDDNPVTKAFELELDYMIRCPKCHHKIMTDPEKIRTLPLALPHSDATSVVTVQQVDLTNDASPTPPTSDLGLDSPETGSMDEEKDGSDEKENLALVNQVTSPEDAMNNTMSIAKLDLGDKQEQQRQANNNAQTIPQKQQDTSQSDPKEKRYTLNDALNNYFKDDLLDYSCSQPGCDSKQRTKKCLIRKLPQVLFITLARYSYTGKKSLDEIEAPFDLSVPFQENKSPSHSPSAHRDLFEDDDNNKYQLVAVVCHLGSSLNAGHYTSYVYNQTSQCWYSCDDDSITKARESDVRGDAKKSGYCFFYAHKSCLAKTSGDGSRNTNHQGHQEQQQSRVNRGQRAMSESASPAPRAEQARTPTSSENLSYFS